MLARRPNPKLVKTHRTYSVEEAAAVCGVHRNTVRKWLKDGLPMIDKKRPVLILGVRLAEFLRIRRDRNKRPCKPGEIYCMRCREPKQPARQQAVYSALTATLGTLIGRCPVCDCQMHRRVSLAKLTLVCGPLHLTMPTAQDHIDESPQPTVNSDFKQEAQDHDKAQP